MSFNSINVIYVCITDQNYHKKSAFAVLHYIQVIFITSLQGPPNVQSPAAWSAMARLSVWNQSSLSPTELKTDKDTVTHVAAY